jgi:beta-lactamase class A
MKFVRMRYFIWLTIACLTPAFLATELQARRRKKRPRVTHLAQTPQRECNIYYAINRRAQALDVEIGFCAELLEQSLQLSHNADNLYPMASTCKVPIALAFLKAVDDQRCWLDERIQLKPSDWRPGAWLSKKRNITRQSFYVRDLLKLMLEYSDNIAADLVLKRVGGPQAVNQLFAMHNICGIRLDRTIQDIMADSDGMSKAYGQNFKLITNEELYKKREYRISPSIARQAQRQFLSDPRDTSSPRAMNEVLKKICSQEILTPFTNQLLLDSMWLCRADTKIPALLPASVDIYHKTGCLPGVSNDVGIIILPHDAGTLVVSVFVKGPNASTCQGARLIAETTKLIYDYMMRHAHKVVPAEEPIAA